MGYLPVRNADLLGVHSEAADMCWFSFTPSEARRSMCGVLRRETEGTLEREVWAAEIERTRDRPGGGPEGKTLRPRQFPELRRRQKLPCTDGELTLCLDPLSGGHWVPDWLLSITGMESLDSTVSRLLRRVLPFKF